MKSENSNNDGRNNPLIYYIINNIKIKKILKL